MYKYILTKRKLEYDILSPIVNLRHVHKTHTCKTKTWITWGILNVYKTCCNNWQYTNAIINEISLHLKNAYHWQSTSKEYK